MPVYNHMDEDPMDTYPYRNQGRRADQEKSSALIIEIVVTLLLLIIAIYFTLNP